MVGSKRKAYSGPLCEALPTSNLKVNSMAGMKSPLKIAKERSASKILWLSEGFSLSLAEHHNL